MSNTKREETLWSVTLSFQDVHDFSSTLTCVEWDALPLGALERVVARYGISRDRVRSVSVEANGCTRTIG